MITSVELTNFRGHASTVVPLDGRLTVLVGPNGVGKTNVLNAVHLLGQAFFKTPEELFRGSRSAEWLIRSNPASAEHSPMGTSAIRLDGCTEARHAKWWAMLSLEAAGAEAARPEDSDVSRAKLSWWPADLKNGDNLEGSASPGSPEAKKAPYEVKEAASAVVLKLEARALAAPSTSEEVEPRIEYDGTGLATALKELKATHLEDFQRFEESARRVIPELRAIGFERVKRVEDVRTPMTVESQRVWVSKKETVIADGLLLQFENTRPLPAHCASEGTILVVGLLAFLHLPSRPKVVLLDDIDRGLHPRAQVELVSRIREILNARIDLQVIATSHSPYLADCLEPEEVVVLSRPTGGVVSARRLAEHPNKKLLQSFKTGEFLSASGEDWFGL